eukprot:3478460-Prymnesium_polylepis.1
MLLFVRYGRKGYGNVVSLGTWAHASFAVCVTGCWLCVSRTRSVAWCCGVLRARGRGGPARGSVTGVDGGRRRVRGEEDAEEDAAATAGRRGQLGAQSNPLHD